MRCITAQSEGQRESVSTTDMPKTFQWARISHCTSSNGSSTPGGPREPFNAKTPLNGNVSGASVLGAKRDLGSISRLAENEKVQTKKTKRQ